MGQDPNQPYPGQYGQPGVPPQSNYQSGYQPQGGYGQPQPGSEYQSGYQQPGGPYQQPGGPYQQPGGPYQQPYGQPGYQQYGQPGYNTAYPNGPTSMNMDPNIAAGLSYLGWLVTGLIFFLVEKQNRFVRFHAMQSIIVSIGLIVLNVVLSILFALPLIGLIGIVIWPLVWLGTAGLWIYLMINAFLGRYVKLPIIGDYAERYANEGIPGI